ncbi:MAG: hypothetical protein FWC76_01830 [Defluviitaleaceae bacterium]|nr:hypothetical protein [Defluviitaleaceae bacterium]
MKKRVLIPLIFAGVFSAFLVFCWVVALFDANWFWGHLAHPIASALGRLNLMGYNHDIGGSHAHLHDIVWLWGVGAFPLAYAAAMGYIVKIKSRQKIHITLLWIAVISGASFVTSAFTVDSFFIMLERSAYSYFVPQV